MTLSWYNKARLVINPLCLQTIQSPYCRKIFSTKGGGSEEWMGLVITDTLISVKVKCRHIQCHKDPGCPQGTTGKKGQKGESN